MNDYDEKSYKRYKQYRLNKYRYQQEQIIFPLSIVLIGAVIVSVWRYVLLALILVAVAVLIFFLLKKYFSKQMHSAQRLIISSEEALNGVEIEVTINNLHKPTAIVLRIPPKAKNGQKYIARNVEIQDDSSKKKRVNICFTIEIRD